MKKILFIVIATISFNLLCAQATKVVIKEQKIENINCLYNKRIDLNRGDTTYNVSISFQNAENETVKDIQSIDFTNKAIFLEFVDNLKSALPKMGTKTNINWKKPLYGIGLYDYSADMFLELPEKKGTGYTTVKKEVVQSVITWLESFTFGKG